MVVSVGVGVWSLTKDSFASKIKIRGQSCSGAGFDDAWVLLGRNFSLGFIGYWMFLAYISGLL